MKKKYELMKDYAEFLSDRFNTANELKDKKNEFLAALKELREE